MLIVIIQPNHHNASPFRSIERLLQSYNLRTASQYTKTIICFTFFLFNSVSFDSSIVVMLSCTTLDSVPSFLGNHLYS